ncbi:Histone-lysine N-methyltransferase SETMAR, partial [Dufourea novaeangliae]
NFRHIFLFYYCKDKNEVQATTTLCVVYEENVSTERQCQNWFSKFHSGNFDVKDAPRYGRSVQADKDEIKTLVETNRCITIREIAGTL